MPDEDDHIARYQRPPRASSNRASPAIRAAALRGSKNIRTYVNEHLNKKIPIIEGGKTRKAPRAEAIALRGTIPDDDLRASSPIAADPAARLCRSAPQRSCRLHPSRLLRPQFADSLYAGALHRTHGFPPRRLSFRRDPAPDHQSSSSLTSLLRRKSRRHRDQLERMPSRPPRIRGAMTSCRAWNFLTLRSLIFGLRRERSARSILPIFVRLLPRSASSDSAIRSLSAATMNSSTARRVWIKVWDHRIRRRRGISCADASNDVLEDSRVRSPRQHVRSQVANRCVEFAREAHDGGKAFRLPFGGLVVGSGRDCPCRRWTSPGRTRCWSLLKCSMRTQGIRSSPTVWPPHSQQ